MQAPPAAAITIAHVSKTFKTRAGDVTALTDVSLRIDRGDFLSVVGPSGCGKTTLLRLISGLESPSGGAVEVHGERPGSRMVKVGVAFQRPVLLPWRTVLGNVLLPLEVGKAPHAGRAVEARARSLLAQVGLQGFENVHPHQLSIGMQQRVSLCRALVTEPDLLLMDEPFAALDAMTREQMSILLHNLWLSHRTTTVFITHSISEAVFLSTRVTVMTARPGRIAMELAVDLPIPRDLSVMGQPRFTELAQTIRRAIYPQEGATDAQGGFALA